MQTGNPQDHAVLISHGLPDIAGGVCERRAWQLLTLLTGRCRVDLFCLAKGPVHWETYRRAHHLAHRMWVEPGGGWQDWLVRPRGHGSSVRMRDVRRLACVLRGQDWHQAAQVVVCTHPRLAPLGYVPPAQWRVCDLADDPAPHHEQAMACLLERCDLLLTPQTMHGNTSSDASQRVLYLPLQVHSDSIVSGLQPVTESEYQAKFWSRLHLHDQASRRLVISTKLAA